MAESAWAPIFTASVTNSDSSASASARVIDDRAALAGGPAPGFAGDVLVSHGQVLDDDGAVGFVQMCVCCPSSGPPRLRPLSRGGCSKIAAARSNVQGETDKAGYR